MTPRKRSKPAKKIVKCSAKNDAKSTVAIHWDIGEKLAKADIGEPIASNPFEVRSQFHLTHFTASFLKASPY